MKKKITESVRKLNNCFGPLPPEELAGCLGISVINYELPKSVSGMYFSAGGKKAIIISTLTDERFRNYYLSHELGHAVLHDKLNYVFLCNNTNLLRGKYEREADYFAAELLLGKKSASEYRDRTLDQLSAGFGIPKFVIEDWLTDGINNNRI